MTRSEPLHMRPIRGVAVDQGSGLGKVLRKVRGAKADARKFDLERRDQHLWPRRPAKA
ncbi:MAG: hypothetical protein ACOH2H_21335 [Cypionkella sp.]